MKKFEGLYFSRQNTNIPLLIFLIFFLNVKFIVKIFAILFILLYYRNFKWGLTLKHSRLPLFYALIIILEFFKYALITRNFSLDYGLVFGLGILQWAFCLLSLHHLKLAVERDSAATINNTIRAFYLLNFGASLFFLSLLIFHPVWLSYWGHGKDITFSNTSAGDVILGISFDTSTVNSTINCLGLIYFLYKKDYLYAFICMSIIVFCTSNVSFIFILLVLTLMILTLRSHLLRLYSFLAACALVFFYLSISASNRLYIHDYFTQLYILNKNPALPFENEKLNKKKCDSLSLFGKLKNRDSPSIQVSSRKIGISTPLSSLKKNNPDSLKKAPNLSNRISLAGGPAIRSLDSARTRDSIRNIYSVNQKMIKKAFGHLLRLDDHGRLIKSPHDSATYLRISNEDYDSKPGKLISFLQTFAYLKSGIGHLLFGAGIGNFSSKLAFRASGVNILGSYPKQFIYASPAFKYNHLSTFNYYIHEPASRHSVMNFPFSVYNQLLGEYGSIGVLLFVLFYLGYFISRYRRLSYGRYMILILLGFFFMEYWFELFSLVVIFELFMLLNIKEGRN